MWGALSAPRPARAARDDLPRDVQRPRAELNQCLTTALDKSEARPSNVRKRRKNSVSSVAGSLIRFCPMSCHLISWCEFFTAEWLTAFGTVGAVFLALFVALYGEQAKRWTFRPALRLRAQVRRPDADKVSRWAVFADGRRVDLGESWYFRLAVFNDGNETAEDVQVFLANVERKRGHKPEKPERIKRGPRGDE